MMALICEQFPYDREKAVAYARYWAYRRNPEYLDFSDLGGNCTNFVSQCLYTGSGVMNTTPTFGWYYNSPEDRTASWTGVEYLYNFLTQNQGDGPYGKVVPLQQIQPGDVAQFSNKEGVFYHTVLILCVPVQPTPANVLVAAHSNDANCRPLDTYPYTGVRFIHIEGVRRCTEQSEESEAPMPPNPPSEVFRPAY